MSTVLPPDTDPAADAEGAPVRVCGWSGEKQLLSTRDTAAGALLLAEYPIAFVPIQAGEDEWAPWLLLEAIVSSPDGFARVDAEDLKMTHWPLDADDEARLDQLSRRYRRNARKLAQLYHRVAANNIRYAHDGRIGYGIWPLLSRSNHSCDPNARIAAAADRPFVELLLATRPIAAGTAVCWNYFSDPAFLQQGWYARNAQLLKNFQFLCQCPRCLTERPAELNTLAKATLAAYFRL